MFNLTVAKEQLITPLLAVAGAVDKKQSLAILANILIACSDGNLFLTATDLEIEITARVHCEENDALGSITVPAKKFIDIIRSLDDKSQPTISYHNNSILIKSGRSQFKLATLPADGFPSSEKESHEVEFSIPRLTLIHLFQLTHFAMSQQDVRVYLNGLLLELDAQSITLVASDGHRMAVCKYPSTQGFSHQRFLLPKKSVQEMLRLLTALDDEQIKLAAGKNHFKLEAKDYTFQSRLIETRFPPYAKAIPKNHDKWVLVDRDMLKRALNRIIILAHEKSHAIILHMNDNTLTLIANNQEQEEAMECLEAQTEGSELKIGLNAIYLMDVLNVLHEGNVRLSMSTRDSSILVESVLDEHYQYVIMPMKL